MGRLIESILFAIPLSFVALGVTTSVIESYQDKNKNIPVYIRLLHLNEDELLDRQWLMPDGTTINFIAQETEKGIAYKRCL